MSTGGALAVIPARGGSRRVPGNYIRQMHGRPRLACSIDGALAIGPSIAGTTGGWRRR